MIDLTKEYKIEQKPKVGDTIGLEANGLSRHVGTFRSFGVSYNHLTRKYKTGLDEFAPEVKALPSGEYEDKVEWIKATKNDLELQIGKVGILDATNGDFWDVWKVDIEVGQDKKVKLFGSHPQFLPNQYWEHKLALITLDANNDLPRSKKESYDPKFLDAQFYLTTTEEAVTMSQGRVKKNRQRNVEMSKLFPTDGGEGGNFERAWSIAYLLGVQKEMNVGIEKLEEVMEIFTIQPEYLDRFLSLCKLADAELAIDVIIKKAINYDVIKFNPVDKIYYRGGHNFRNNEADTSKYFKVNQGESSVARELAEISEAVRKRDSKNKKK